MDSGSEVLQRSMLEELVEAVCTEVGMVQTALTRAFV